MMHRLPVSETIRPHVISVLSLMLTLIREDNEENVLICLRIIIDLHKQYRPPFYPQIKEFLAYIQNIYSNLPHKMIKIFDPRFSRLDKANFNIDDIYTLTDKIMPKGRNSFKVLQELPIVLVLLYQLYKQNVHDHVVVFLPAILNTITLEPKKEFRDHEIFNRELFVDFLGAQIKTLAFLAYTIKTFSGGLMEIIENHAKTLVEGMILLLRLCPKEVAHLRKELLVATRHILATNLRTHFIPSLELLFDEDLLLGKSGYTALCSLRPLAFSTLGDFIHHVRMELNLEVLSKAIQLFSKNVHDETLPLAIQIMSIRLLLNLVECIRTQRQLDMNVSDASIRKTLLQNMMKVFILKFHTIGKMQMPIITEKWKLTGNQQLTSSGVADSTTKEFTSVEIIPEAISKLTSIGFTPPSNLNLTEYKLLIKSLIGGIKTIMFGISFIDNGAQPNQQISIVLSPQEVQYFINFFNWSLEAFYVYRINTFGNNQQKLALSVAAQREEKELLELFSGLFLNLSSQNFQEIFTACIDTLIDKMKTNQNLQIIINTFLSYRATSPIFASVMVEFLLKRMKVIGSSDTELSNLYLKMYKLIFGSVSMFCVENEGMIRPYLQTIVVNSMEMAMRAEEPYNYFLLLRALFRSIGGGTYDILYQEFLPLLPSLLGGLNKLQSGCHEQQMKDLFVELCLTVPVRLSSLLPFLPMLMEPLVSALNGSPTLVNQGLRTLELCVDNLLPDFFCDHIQPVRAELMQSLWKTLRNHDNSSMGAFRILGKFGGGNRNMLIEPQKLEHQDIEHDSLTLKLSYSNKRIEVPAKNIIKSAFQILKTSNEPFYLKESWNVVKLFLLSNIELDDDQNLMMNLLQQTEYIVMENIGQDIVKTSNNENEVMQVALSAMFLASHLKDVKKEALPITIHIVERLTIIAIAYQTGTIQKTSEESLQKPLLMFDGLFSLLDSEDKTIYNFAISILQIILKIAINVMGSLNRIANLPMTQYMFERAIDLLYEKSSYAQKGGCIILKFLCEQLPASLFFKNLFAIFKSHLFVIRDLSDNVCRGTIDVAETNIDFLLEIIMNYVSSNNMTEEYIKVYNSIVNELVLQTASPHKLIRQVATKSLRKIAQLQKTNVSNLLEPYKNFFAEVIVFSPAKTYLRHQPLSTQIGILEANYFCTSLEPKLMKFDNFQFLTDVKIIIKCDDDTMSRCDAYKDPKVLPELRESAMRVLVSWHYIYHNQHYDTDKVKNINFCEDAFITLFKALENHQNLQETAFECLKKLIDDCKEKSETGWPVQHSFLESLGDYNSWTSNSIKRLSYYCLLFPKMFTEKTCEQLFEIVKKLIQNSIIANKDQNYLKIAKTGETELKIAAIIDLFHLIPTCSAKFVILLIRLVMTFEENVSIETSCPYREPLIKFLLRFPEETITFLLADEQIKNQQYNRFTIFLLKNIDGNVFKSVMENRSSRLKELILRVNSSPSKNEQYHAILIIRTITELNNQWLSSQMGIVDALNHIWRIDLNKNVDQYNMVCDYWHLVTKILLHYFEHNPGDIDLLFQLLNIFNVRFVPDFQFFRDFIYTICQNYTVDWKRNAFFMFVDYYNRPTVTTDLKIKILTMILIPSFAISFDKGEESRLIRGLTQDEESNIISVFINKIVNPFMMKENDDGLRIVLLQFACLLVERASPYIQSNKKEDIRQLTTFGYSSLLHSKNFWDPTAVYNGHLLLSHIIAKLANKKSWQEVVFKVFHSLLKAHAIEARNIVRQTLEVFMPMMPLKMNDQSNLSLINLTKSVIIKDGHAILQLYHVFQVIIRHHSIYYPVRHEIIQNMIQSMQRLESSNSIDYRKLAIDIAEVIINWELKRIKDNAEEQEKMTTTGGIKRSHQELLQSTIKKQAIGEYSPQPGTSQMSLISIDDTSNKPIEWIHCKSVINFLFDLLFMLSEQITTQLSSIVSPNEVISKHSLNLLKKVLKKEVWIKENEDLQLTRLKKVFEEPSKVSSTTVCNFLEIFIHLLDELDETKLLLIIKTLQPGLAICITSAQTKVLRLMSTFLSKLFSLFPPEIYMKHDELRFLYQTVEKAIRNGLEVFEKDTETPTASFFGTFLILKTAFSNDSKYFEKFVEKFTRFVVLLKTDHLNVNSQQQAPSQTPSPNNELTKEMLMQSLHLLKIYLSIMSTETRKTYINVILIDLIEKSSDSKIIKTIIQLLESWFHLKDPLNEPCLREKVLLLQKLTYHVENRFSSDSALNGQFLELIYYIFSNPQTNTIELTSRLDHAFLGGLKCTQYDIRQKFFTYFNKTVEKSVYTRLMYILSTRTWDSISHHYWIKQCIELLFLTVDCDSIFNMTANNHKLPKITKSIDMIPMFCQQNEDFKNFDLNENNEEISNIVNSYNAIGSRDLFIAKLASSQMKFSKLSHDLNTENFLKGVVQICHVDKKLSEKLWIKVFPQLWSNFDYSQRLELTKEIIPFLSNGTKINLNGVNQSALNTFVQALSICNPPVPMSPKLLKSISKIHNTWHTVALLTEDMFESFMKERENLEISEFDEEPEDEMLIEVFGSLSSLYSSLKEEDLWAGLWKTHAKYPETNIAIFYEQMGYFEEAQNNYENVLLKFKQDVSNGMNTVSISDEIELWEDHWIRCTRELNDWSNLLSYTATNKDKFILHIIDCAWKMSDWNLMHQSYLRAEQLISKQNDSKVGLYGGYISLLCQKETVIAKYIENASMASLHQWRHLPHVISNAHIPILQNAQQIMELQEAGQIHQDLLRKQALPFHDMKSIIKTWRNRLPIISDDLSHWKDIFTWRQHHYKLIVENASGSNHVVANLGSQASAQTYIKFAKIARKQNLSVSCQKSLTEIDSIASIPIADCFQKIVQQIKYFMNLSQYASDPKINLTDALKIVENVNFDLFQPELKSILHGYKGYLQTYLGNTTDANKLFQTAVELCDNSTKVWAFYGEYMENLFKRNPKKAVSSGISALTCFLHASREHNEMKSRKYLAKVLWLLTYNETRTDMFKVMDNYMFGIPMINWLSWIPQLFNALVQYECDTIMNLLNQIAKIFPQAVYFPIRTLYLMLKIEQRERYKNIEHFKSFGDQPGTSTMNQSNMLSMKSTPAMWRCSKIMQLVREVHPTIVCSLENILDQLMSKSDIDGTRWFRENVFEENLHQLKQGLAKCYGIAFDNRLSINEATTTQHTVNFIRKLISNFSIASENASENLLQDPVFNKLRQQFIEGFNFQQPESNKLIDLIKRLKACIKIMEMKVKYLSKSFLIEEKYRFLSNFSNKTAEIDLPGELLLPRHSHYHIKIAKFMPRVEIVQKHNTSARRVLIQGTNGKIYPYLVVNDSGMIDARREERVLQLLRMLSGYLTKFKETSRRFLSITIPRVIPIYPQMRLVEDNPSSSSLLDILKMHSSKSNTDYNAAISSYYERLIEIQRRGAQTSHMILKDIFLEIQKKMIPKTILKDWANQAFTSSTDYWTFRKMLTLQLALWSTVEYAFHLTRLNPEQMYVHQDSGLINVSYYKFDLDDSNGEMSSLKPVPFRLTPNITEFISNVGVLGPYTACMMATSRCFLQPNFQVPTILRTILRDEYIMYFRRIIMNSTPIDLNDDLSQDKSYNEINSDNVIESIDKSVNLALKRLEEIMTFDTTEDETKVSQLIEKARNQDFLSHMDPIWFPWF
ncbi:hypothetical protein ACKWTF_011837 [Chironomus riparius]